MIKRQTSALQRWARSGLAPDSRFSRLKSGHLTAHLFQQTGPAASDLMPHSPVCDIDRVDSCASLP